MNNGLVNGLEMGEDVGMECLIVLKGENGRMDEESRGRRVEGHGRVVEDDGGEERHGLDLTRAIRLPLYRTGEM